MTPPRVLHPADIEIVVEALPEDTTPWDELEGLEDEEYIQEIADRLEDGDTWAWCIACVSVRWGPFSGESYLGSCSYESGDHFREDCGNYASLVEEAFCELLERLTASSEYTSGDLAIAFDSMNEMAAVLVANLGAGFTPRLGRLLMQVPECRWHDGIRAMSLVPMSPEDAAEAISRTVKESTATEGLRVFKEAMQLNGVGAARALKDLPDDVLSHLKTEDLQPLLTSHDAEARAAAIISLGKVRKPVKRETNPILP